MVGWDVLDLFIMDLIGFTNLGVPSGGYAPLSRTLPDRHPRWRSLYCTEVEVAGRGFTWDATGRTATMQDSSGSIQFNKAAVKATYRNLDYDIVNDAGITTELDRYVVRSFGYNGIYATVDGKMFFCSKITDSNGNLVSPLSGTQPGRMIPQVEKTLTWMQVPANPSDPDNPPTYAAIKSLQGKINQAPFDGDPAGTVLFLGTDPHRSKPHLVNGAIYWTLVYKFMVTNNGSGINAYDGTGGCPNTATEDCYAGWNYIINPYLTTPRFDLLTRTGLKTGARIYESGDFTQLFKIPS